MAKRRKKRARKLTVERIRELLRQGAARADELHERLERSHLAGYSAAMALRLD